MKQTASLESNLSTIRTEGGLLPADILAKILAGDGGLPGTSAEDYHLPKGEKLNESINRAWTRVRALWDKFHLQRESLTETDTGTSQTRETLLLPLFAELGYGRLFASKAEDRTVGDKSFSISHFWHKSPIHLVGCNVELDRKAKGVRGAAQSSPHSMVQDFLNRSEGHLWGFCSNGLRLRILRDNQSLSRQAFIEFDLESMFDGEVFSDFALLWLLCHQSRVESEDTATCWLEVWARSAQDQGVRALDTLRESVRKTIEILGQGFLAHHNPDLKERLRSGTLNRQDYFRQLLRLVYRLLFLFAAEDRGLLHAQGTPEEARKRFASWHSTTRLRRLAGKLGGTKHHDLYEGLKLIMHKLGSEDGCAELGLSPLGSFLWSDDALPDLIKAKLANEYLLKAVRALAYTEAESLRRPVDYKNVGARELGSIYESLLELHPDLDTLSGSFTLQTASGNERKTTGSYYTPTPLINSLLDSALEPVIQQAMAQDDPEAAILNLKVCDPACGSGHFLIAAAHRLAKRLAGVRTGDEEPGPDAVRTALRDVIGRCIYGVDVNPMAVELCKVSLWLEALEPGKPLSFLDHHIRCGNSLIGATPELIAAGLPDDAFKPIQGDDKAACAALKKRNKAAQKKSSLPFLVKQEAEVQAKLRQAASTLEALPSESLKDILAKENAFRQHESTPEFKHKKMLADAWCAAFVIPKCFPPKPGDPQLLSDEPVGITQRELNAYAMGQALPQELAHTVEELATQYQFFHWHLAFPEVFGTGGFDVILGNPPWEQLEQQDTITFDQHLACMQSFIERCNKYKFTSSGRKNLYGLFAELSIQIKSSKGASGLILPTGIIQDHPQSSLTSYLMENLMLSSVYDFENKIKGASGSKWFGDAHPQQRFCLYTVKSNCKVTKFSCDLSNPKEIDLDYKKYYLNYNDVIKLCYKNFKVPIYPYNFDKQICQKCYNQGTILGSLMDGDNPKIISTLLFNADKVSKKIRKSIFEKQKTDISIYEGSYIHHFDHRYATYYGNKTNKTTPIQKNNQFYEIDTQFYIDENEAKSRIVSTLGTTTKWILALRRQARSSDSFIAISSLIPAVATEGSITAFLSRDENSVYLQSLCANFNSYIFNYLTRLIQSGPNLNKSIYSQLPIIIPNTKFIDKEFKYFIFPRLFEMTYTSWAMSCFANEFKFNNPPFIWNENRRFLLRCELDAAFFHLYLTSNQNGEWIRENNESENDFSSLCETFPTPRHAVNYIMDTFPIVKRKDEEKYGEYRTKRIILEIFEAIQNAIATGQPYQTRLDPPPADRRCCHPEKSPEQA